jgi:prepilin-type N-terminal cleavage/methylation domain-containing protein
MIAAGKKRPILPETGFTLMEMLIAVTLVAMMAVGLWAALRISIRSWSRGSEFIDADQRHRTIQDMVQKQIASTYGLYAPADIQQGGAPYLIFSGTENSIQFVSLNSLRFLESPGLTLVHYEVAQDSTGDYSLVEKEARYTGWLPDQEAAESFSEATPLFQKLSSCTFEYFDPGDNDNPPQWRREWDGQKMGRLPWAVSMTMIFRDPRGNSLNRHMVVPIQAQESNISTPMNPFLSRRRVLR